MLVPVVLRTHMPNRVAHFLSVQWQSESFVTVICSLLRSSVRKATIIPVTAHVMFKSTCDVSKRDVRTLSALQLSESLKTPV